MGERGETTCMCSKLHATMNHSVRMRAMEERERKMQRKGGIHYAGESGEGWMQKNEAKLLTKFRKNAEVLATPPRFYA